MAEIDPSKPSELNTAPQSQNHDDDASLAADFWLLLALFLSFRLLTLFLLRPGGFIRDWSDFDTYLGIAALSDYGLFPYLDFWLEWPPLAPWLMVGAYKLSLLFPPWTEARLGFVSILGLVFVLFEAGNFWLIYRLARRLAAGQTVRRVLWLYLGLFPPVYAMLGFFDGAALFFLLLALDFLLDRRPLASALAAGVGFMVKLIPLLAVPVALRYLWDRHGANRRSLAVEWGLYLVTFALSILALAAPFLWLGPQWVLAGARAVLGRSSWETVWAVLEGYYGFGQVAGDRLNPAETAFAVYPSTLPWPLIGLAFGLLFAVLFLRRADYRPPRNVVAFAGLTVALFLLYSKGYSPQFLVYVLPFTILLLPNARGLTYALLLTALNVVEQPLYFVLLPSETWLLAGVVVARSLLFLLLAVEFGLILWPGALPELDRAQRWAGPVLAGLFILAALLAVPPAWRAYAAGRLADEPAQTFVGFMRTQAGRPPARLLLTDQDTYRRLYPFLRGGYEVRLAGGQNRYPAAPSTADLIADQPAVWLLPTGEGGRVVQNVIGGRGGEPLAAYDFAGLGTVYRYALSGGGPRPVAPARLAPGLELLAYDVEQARAGLTVTLYWRAVSGQTQSYTVFTQLLDEAGVLAAGHDGLPADGTAPTQTWPVGQVVMDRHHIAYPDAFTPGDYQLLVGMYDAGLNRLTALAPSGQVFENNAVPLGILSLP
ncbi:MAG: hypothetical protein ACE5H9_11560 [Anaerolineae bacterium]